jgi:hypothetical protein
MPTAAQIRAKAKIKALQEQSPASVFQTPLPPQQRKMNPTAPPPPTQEAPWWGGQAQGDVAGAMSMEGYGQPLTPEAKQALFQTGGGVAGAGLGMLLGGPGGSVAGGAAGYSIGDTLHNAIYGDNINPYKLRDYREALIGPQGDGGADWGAVGSLAEGAAFEALPLGLGKAARSLIPKGWAKRLYTKAAKFNNLDKDVIDEVVQYGLDKRLAIGKGGLDKVQDIIVKSLKIADDRIEVLAEQGKKVDLYDVLKTSKEYVDDSIGKFKMGGDDAAKSASKGNKSYVNSKGETVYTGQTGGSAKKIAKRQAYIDEEIAPELRSQFQEGLSPNMEIDPRTALNMRRKIDADTSTAWWNAQKAHGTGFDTVENDANMRFADALRNSLNADPIMKGANAGAHEGLNWIRATEGAMKKQANASLVPSEVILPLAMESVIKGGPGIATALGVARAMSNNPGILSRIAIGANVMKTSTGKLTPKIQTSLLIAQAVKAKLGEDEFNKLVKIIDDGGGAYVRK